MLKNDEHDVERTLGPSDIEEVASLKNTVFMMLHVLKSISKLVNGKISLIA
jgi:hypothetical protein